MKYCPKCNTPYMDWAKHCNTCDVDLPDDLIVNMEPTNIEPTADIKSFFWINLQKFFANLLLVFGTMGVIILASSIVDGVRRNAFLVWLGVFVGGELLLLISVSSLMIFIGIAEDVRTIRNKKE